MFDLRFLKGSGQEYPAKEHPRSRDQHLHRVASRLEAVLLRLRV